jgi:hypothetical protein
MVLAGGNSIMNGGHDELAKAGGNAIDDIWRYILTGEFTPAMYLKALEADARKSCASKRSDRPDGPRTDSE